MQRLATCVLLALLGACRAPKEATHDATTEAICHDGPVVPAGPVDVSASAVAAADYDLYGAGTTPAAAVPLAKVLAEPTPYLGRPIKLAGPIAGTCAKKGCWMQLGSEADNVFVKFKDYGFFVPTSGVEGREAVVEGELAVETQTVEQVKHYLEDAGKHEEAAKVTEPKRVLRFLATGVAIKKPTP